MRLLAEPAANVLAERGVAATNGNVASATANARRWLTNVIDAKYLPAVLELQCIRGEFEDRDVVRSSWKAGEYSFRVAQTVSVFVMEVRPATGKLPGESTEARVGTVRRLCSDVLVKTGSRWTGQREKVAIPALNVKILDYSFHNATTTAVAEHPLVLHGRPKPMTEVQYTTNAELGALDAKENPAWHQSFLTWLYWFRNVFWFSDDERVVIYFLKTEGGPIALNFFGGMDGKWFK
jgi:hypothetical protein